MSPHPSDPVTYDEMAAAAQALRVRATSRIPTRYELRATYERVADMLDDQLPGPVVTAVHQALVDTGVYDDVDGEADSASILADHVRRLPGLVDDEITDEASNAAAGITREFHETYERLAPSHGYETRRASAVPWDEVPEQNRALMLAVVGDLIDRHVIRAGNPPGSCRGPDGSDLCGRERYHPGPCDPAERPA